MFLIKILQNFSSEETTDSSETTTTTEPYRISRYELGRILGRNFRGLKRLQEIEFKDALNVSYFGIYTLFNILY